MLKYQLDSLEGLEPAVAAMYEEKGGKHVLKVDGIPQGEDVSGLKTKNQELLDELKQFKGKAKDAEEAARKAADDAARKSGDVEALENSWKEKFTKREQELLGLLDGSTGQIKALTVGRTATDLAAELAVQGSAKALLPHIERRLSMEIRDGRPTVVVLDAAGKPSASTLDELKTEFAADPVFAPLIAASKASGGGAGGARHGGGAAGVPKTLAECKGDPALETKYFEAKLAERN